jgi:hypothetical protein
MSNAILEEAVRNTVAGSKWYYQAGRSWHEATVERVTKTMVILANGVRIPKKTRWADGHIWFPPTPEMVSLYEAQEIQAAAQTVYVAALERLQAVARKVTPTQLRQLATQMENAIKEVGDSQG